MNTITLTDYKITVQWEISQEDLDNLLNTLLDDLILWKDPNSIFEVQITCEEFGEVIHNHIQEEAFIRIQKYCIENFSQNHYWQFHRKKDWARKPRKKGKGEYVPLYGFYSTADDIERQKVEGGEIHWRKMMKNENI